MSKNFQIFHPDFSEEDPEEVVQLIASEEIPSLTDDQLPDELPILPIKNTVLFPGIVIPITVGREKSVKLVKQAYRGDRIIGVTAQKNLKIEEPGISDLNSIGTVAKILKMLVLPDGNTTIIIQGQKRFKMLALTSEKPFIKAKYEILHDLDFDLEKENTEAIVQSLKDTAHKIMKLNPEIPKEAQIALDNIDSHSFLTHFLAGNVNAEVAEKQKLLEINDPIKRAEKLLQLMMKDLQMLELKKEIQKKVHTDIDQQQRDYFLRQQMRILQNELGNDGPDQEIETLKTRGDEKNWPEEVKIHFFKETDKIQRMNPAAAEYPVAMNYVELLVDLPWNELTADNFDLKNSQKILDRDHFGLDKVKDRILEYLAVRKLKDDLKGPIICLYGPPGVGKTSLGKSIAEALGRKYIRMSLGGLHDEAEIRGHRKTYIGSMPGKILQNIKRAKSSNPVFILDEIDKINANFRGDPSSALLEALDPEQNNTFNDHYLEVDYDLSNVMFVTTANTLNIPGPLLDRMEIIRISGYTEDEKSEIAKKYLIPKQIKDSGLEEGEWKIDDESIKSIIRHYTRESGVRGLEREISKLTRKAVKEIVTSKSSTIDLKNDQVENYLGVKKFKHGEIELDDRVGTVTGLAWTEVGGEILSIETLVMPGKGKLQLTGKLGDVMKESMHAAKSFVRSRCLEFGIIPPVFEKKDIHIHVPEGATPKDGPSAGIGMVTAIVSALTNTPVKKDVAMTGEVTLSGRVLPIGGLKEKLLAALRGGIKTAIIPAENEKDLKEIPDNVKQGLKIIPVKHVEEVLKIALTKSLKPVEWVEIEQIPSNNNKGTSQESKH